MTEQVQETEGEGELHAARRCVRVERPESPEQQREAQRLRIALGREARHRLDHPGALAQALEILSEPAKWFADVELIEPDQRAPLPLEADRVSPGEELQRAGKP